MKSDGLHWTEEQFAAHMARFKTEGNDRAAVQAADVEPADVHTGKAADKAHGVHSRVRIAVHSRRRRLADPDGVSAKAVIDGLRAGGLIVDDSARYVEGVSYSQEKSKVEETVISVWEIQE